MADLAGAALDSLAHIRGGPARHLDLVASQLEASSLFEYRFTRALEDAYGQMWALAQAGLPPRPIRAGAAAA